MSENTNDWLGYEGYTEEEMHAAMWEEDGPPTLEDENLFLVFKDGCISLVGRGGCLQTFEPAADLDAALVEAYIKALGG
jgi:hypothetical protein